MFLCSLIIIGAIIITQFIAIMEYRKDMFVEVGVIEKGSDIGRIKINGYEWYIDNSNAWDLQSYYGKCVKITYESGCGQTLIRFIDVLCPCECE